MKTGIEYKCGDLFGEHSEALVNAVNCVGVMGRGIALQFHKRFPQNYQAYVRACRNGEVRPGRMFVFDTEGATPPRYIINFPTKRHWRNKSRLEDLEAGLEALVAAIRQYDIRSVSLPALACGLGGLDWSQIKPLIHKSMQALSNVQTIIYEPTNIPDKKTNIKKQGSSKMTAAKAVLIGLMNRYLDGLCDPFVSLLEAHKLMYFMQQTGGTLGLQYKADNCGPYTKDMRDLLRSMEGSFISALKDGSDSPYQELKLMPGAIEEAEEYLRQHPQSNGRFDRVAALIEGFESPDGLELLSSVHWIMEKEHTQSLDEVVAHLHSWNERKRRFTERQINITREELLNQGWITQATSQAAERSN